jgi:spore coat protein H
MITSRARRSARWLAVAAALPCLVGCSGSRKQTLSSDAAAPGASVQGDVGAGRAADAARSIRDSPSLSSRAEPSTAATNGENLRAGGAPAPEGVPAGVPLPRSTDARVEVSDDGEQTWVFDPAAVHTYELTLDPEVWANLQRDALQEQYVPADLLAAGRSLARVGLRFKGSLGTLVSCFADDGSLRCSKLSMKVEFDEYVADQRFFGLRRLNFNSMLFDDTLMHERIAYRVYREMGLVAPRSAHARLIINGEDWGLFSLVEEVDGPFTDRHFEHGDGNLYKEAWPGNTDEGLLNEALKTNEESADHSAFLRFQADLLAASPAALPAVVERYLDLDATLAYLAVDQALANWDGVTAFYCYDDASCENHNYYWYQDELEPRFTLIPWDLDNTLESSPLIGVPGVFEVPVNCSLRYAAMGRTLRAPGCDALLRGLSSAGPDRYVAQLERLLQGPLAPGVIEDWIDELEAQLEPEVTTDARGPDVSTFRSAVAHLRESLALRRERARLERAAPR